MDPTQEEMTNFTGMQGIFDWLECDESFVSSLKAAVGARTLTLRTWARIPPTRFAELKDTLKIKEGDEQRNLTPIEEGQLGDVARIVVLTMSAQGPPSRGGQVQQQQGQPGGAQVEERTGIFAPGGGAGSSGGGRLALPLPRRGQVDVDALPDFDTDPNQQTFQQSLVPGELGASRVKLSTVLDQGDDSEIRPISNAELQGMMATWKTQHNDGEEPSEEVEATGDQISALAFRIRSGGTPFVDFGVWRPNAVDLGRSLKFSAYFLSPTGEFQRKELVGPTTYTDWVKSWKVYAFAMEFIGAATRTRLAKYAEQIAALNSDYPSLWWLVSMADIKMRKTYMERIRRRLANEHLELTQSGLTSTYNAKMPWDSVYREAARDGDFWQREVEKKVVQFTTAQKSRPQLMDAGFGALTFANLAGAGRGSGDAMDDEGGGIKRKNRHQRRKEAAKKRELEQGSGTPAITNGNWTGNSGGKGKGKGKDPNRKVNNKYVADENNVQICWAWNKARDGCKTPCPNARAHICEICRGSHRTVDHKA